MATKIPAGTPTDLNLFTLNDMFRGAQSVANRVEATSVNGLRRCLKFGLVTATREALTLTELGEQALAGWAFDRGGWCGPLDLSILKIGEAR